jgi:diguanylate cyclase (GGDEF)-like protein
MPARSVQSGNSPNAVGFRICPPDPAVAASKTLTTRKPPKQNLEELFSSAMLASDRELGNVVGEIDRIWKALKFDSDLEARRVAVHPAVWSAVKHAIIEKELRQLALTDELTCLYNGRGFFAAAAHQLKLAQRNGESVLLVLCDVDRLKQINDSFGHREGDLTLVRVANALEETFRDSDIVARLSGDEFAALAPTASDLNLQALVCRLRKSLQQSSVSEPRYQLSVTVGWAQFHSERPVHLGELVAAAYRRLDQEKMGEAETAHATLRSSRPPLARV